jgi:hypothetical protein
MLNNAKAQPAINAQPSTSLRVQFACVKDILEAASSNGKSQINRNLATIFPENPYFACHLIS